MFDDIFGGIASIVGTVVGTVVGVSAYAISVALGLSITVVQSALKAGCTTYQEIKEFAEENS